MSGNSESPIERKCKRSACWYFYEKTPGGGFCKICQKEILTQAGGTTNLRNHLRRKHGELWSATMENRLDPATLQITGPSSSNPGEGMAASEEDPNEAVAEPGTAVHTIQAYRDANGTTFLYLQPASEGEQGVQIQNAQFQPIVATSESITNGEIVSLAVQKEPPVQEGQAVEVEPKTQEEVSPKKIVHAPVKNYQGSSVASRAIVRQVARPNPIKTVSHSPSSNNYNNNNNTNSNKEDAFEAFGKYIASMLRNLPSKSAWKLQGEIVNWILKEQIKNSTC